jgi:tetratricopeptide (TPR) repeat protein
MRAPYGEAVALWRSIGDRRELANALYNYAFCFSIQPNTGGEPASIDPTGEGREALDQALALYRELGDESGQANVLWGIGNLHYFNGELGASAAEFEEALPLQRRAGNQTMVAWSLHMLGAALLQLHELDRARGILTEALKMFHASGDASGLTLVFDDFASLAAAAGEPERAARLWGAARSLTASTGTGLASLVDEGHEQFRRPHARAMLDPAEAERLAKEGAAMTLDGVVAYALGAEAPESS